MAKPLDNKKLLEECDDEQSFANRCLLVFIRDTKVDIDDISVALGSKHFPEIARLAHRIKGASASIRADFLRDEASRLEDFAATADADNVRDCLNRLENEFDHFHRYIKSLPLNPE